MTADQGAARKEGRKAEEHEQTEVRENLVDCGQGGQGEGCQVEEEGHLWVQPGAARLGVACMPMTIACVACPQCACETCALLG